MKEYDIVIIGGGSAGMAAAIAAKESGEENILVLDRENNLGGILNQCIHSGYGNKTFGEEITGPEYAQRFIDKIDKLGIEYKLNTNVLKLSKDKKIRLINGIDGLIDISAKAVIVATGCREIPKGMLNIPKSRLAGIFTAGSAQKLINIDGYMPGKEILIFGSGNIALIMARRLTIEGGKVLAVVETRTKTEGLEENVRQCLYDFDIPLLLSHTVMDIHGVDRVEGVTIAQVDENQKPIDSTAQYIECDTLILSVELVPENIILKDIHGIIDDENIYKNEEGIFACGNVIRIHDYVDDVTFEGYKAGKSAAEYLKKLKENN